MLIFFILIFCLFLVVRQINLKHLSNPNYSWVFGKINVIVLSLSLSLSQFALLIQIMVEKVINKYYRRLMKEGTKFDLWNWKQPQLISLIITVLIIFIFSITIYLKVRKTKANKASKGIVQIAEAYVGMVEANFESVAGPTKIKPAKIYIFTLGTFLLVGNLVVLFGFEPIVTSYSVPFTLAIFTWFGVMLVGTIYEKLKFYRKLLIPTELIGKLSIIVSLSLRIYGNIIGGSPF
ncbi:F0F1 ATP synthase subunit A [Mycoplasmopsis cynos]|uniref:F0F1 ATP synthase subunit A n=1 Tax=Mycoplasmopsis cynos TaxID=171284 RepID=UPI0024C5F5E2|nr:F0F1 ATP synthase subunit A [Mycoplasmopsis cynos]WAM04533.1 F0F1 ATP synthase subunit A [Mycoplasmopsis cynos]